jgi:hypothetical protein
VEAFSNSTDASRALNKSIVFLKDKPVYATWYDGNMFKFYTVGSTAESVSMDYRHADIIDKIPTLGYVNTKPKAIYVVRNIQEGGSVRSAGLPLRYLTDHTGRSVGADYWYEKKELADMLTNKYPSLEEALGMLSPERYLIAFHKNYAVSHDKRIYHKDRLICSLGTNVITGKYDVSYHEDGIRKPSTIMKRFNDLFLETIRDIEAQ